MGIDDRSSGLLSPGLECAGNMHVDCTSPVKVTDFKLCLACRMSLRVPSIVRSLPVNFGVGRGWDAGAFFCGVAISGNKKISETRSLIPFMDLTLRV